MILIDINTKASVLSSGKIGKCGNLMGEETLPSSQSIATEQAKFTYSPLIKPFVKQQKANKKE